MTLKKILLALTVLALPAAAAMATLSAPAHADGAAPAVLDPNDPSTQAAFDGLMDKWIAKDENLSKLMAKVQAHLQAEAEKNQPHLEDFTGRAAELTAGDAPHDGADLASAKIVAVEFFDFNCPFCKALHDELKKVKADPKNADIAFVYRDMPILDPVSSFEAAYAGRVAMAQGKYPQMAGALFTLPSHGITVEGVRQMAAQAGLDMSTYDADMKKQEFRDGVAKTLGEAKSLHIGGTPFTFLWSPERKQGTIVPGMMPAEQLQGVIDQLKKGEAPAAAQ